jgi:hypothetical protein
MRMVVITYSGSNPGLVRDLLDAGAAVGYTELDRAHGVGATGRREGSRAWPGESAVFFSIVPQDRVDQLMARLKNQADAMPPGERLHVAVMPIEQFY